MADRLQTLRVVDPVLTNLALGYSNASLIGSGLAPFVPVEKEGGKIPKFGKAAFRQYNTERALRGNSNIINPEGLNTVDFATTEHDLAHPIDYREDEEAMFPIEASATNIVVEGIRLRHEKQIADLAQDDANYPSGHKDTLTGDEKFSSDKSTPGAVVDDAKEQIRSVIAREPNIMVVGAVVMKRLKRHPELIEAYKYSQKGILTDEMVRDYFGVDFLLVGKAITVSDADVATDIWLDNLILAYVPQTPADRASVYTPSFAYTLRKRGMPQVDKYPSADGKVRYIRNTDNFIPKIVGSDAGYLIKDCI